VGRIVSAISGIDDRDADTVDDRVSAEGNDPNTLAVAQS
jgi:hypothetical protein